MHLLQKDNKVKRSTPSKKDSEIKYINLQLKTSKIKTNKIKYINFQLKTIK